MTDRQTPPHPVRVTSDTEGAFFMRGATVNNAERVPGSGLDANSSISVREMQGVWSSYSLTKQNGDLTRTVTTDMFNGDITVRTEEGHARAQYTEAHSSAVTEAVDKAVQRAFSDRTLTPQEAVKFEKLRQTIAAAVVDDGIIDAAETRAIVRRASRIAPEGHER